LWGVTAYLTMLFLEQCAKCFWFESTSEIPSFSSLISLGLFTRQTLLKICSFEFFSVYEERKPRRSSCLKEHKALTTYQTAHKLLYLVVFFFMHKETGAKAWKWNSSQHVLFLSTFYSIFIIIQLGTKTLKKLVKKRAIGVESMSYFFADAPLFLAVRNI